MRCFPQPFNNQVDVFVSFGRDKQGVELNQFLKDLGRLEQQLGFVGNRDNLLYRVVKLNSDVGNGFVDL